MTAQSQHIIEEFEALPDAAKREVLAELIRSSRFLEYPQISDDELLSAADTLFLEYDRQETEE
ncbi:MAG: hypothetical protein M3P06_00030 [Acidobacteriota bacterium]|nr:hypothetical protein [Acidobacteriota bacterium]